MLGPRAHDVEAVEQPLAPHRLEHNVPEFLFGLRMLADSPLTQVQVGNDGVDRVWAAARVLSASGQDAVWQTAHGRKCGVLRASAFLLLSPVMPHLYYVTDLHAGNIERRYLDIASARPNPDVRLHLKTG